MRIQYHITHQFIHENILTKPQKGKSDPKLSEEARSEREIEITSVPDDDVFEEVGVRHCEQLRLESGRRIVVKENRERKRRE